MSSCIFTNSAEYKRLQKITGLHNVTLNEIIHEYQNSHLDNPDAFPSSADVYAILHKRFYTSIEAIDFYKKHLHGKFKNGYLNLTENEYKTLKSKLDLYFNGKYKIIDERLTKSGNKKYIFNINTPLLADGVDIVKFTQKLYERLYKIEDNIERWKKEILDKGTVEKAKIYMEDEMARTIGINIMPKNLYHVYRNEKTEKIELQIKRLLDHYKNMIKILEQEQKERNEIAAEIEAENAKEIKNVLFSDRKVSLETLKEHLYNLTEKFGISVEFLNDTEYKEMFNDGSSAQYFNGTAYFNSDAVLTKNIGVEEILHPYIYQLSITQPEVFERFYFNAKKTLPKLVQEIEQNYKHNKEEEVVAQILAKYLNKEIATTEKNKSLLESIWEVLCDILDYFSWHKMMEKRYNKDYFNNETLGIVEENGYYRITSEFAYEGITSYEDLAKLLNSKDVKIDVYKGSLQRAHLEQNNNTEQKGNTNNKILEYNTKTRELTINDVETNVDDIVEELKEKVIFEQFGRNAKINSNTISDNKIKLFKAVQKLNNTSDYISITGKRKIQINKQDYDSLSDESRKWLNKQPRQNATNGDLIVELPNRIFIYNHSEQDNINGFAINLLNSQDITSVEIAELAKDFTKEFLKRVEDIRQSKEEYKNKNDVEILNEYGVDKLFSELRNTLLYIHNTNLKNKDKKIKDKYETLFLYWAPFRYLIINNLTKYGIQINLQGLQTSEEESVLSVMEDTLEQDLDTVQETEGDIREHWQKNVKLLSIHDTVLQSVKKMLGSLKDVDKDGNVKYNDLGFEKSVDGEVALVQIVNLCKGCETLDDMIDIISKNTSSIPYLNQVLDRLTVKDGEKITLQKAVLQSQFFTSIYKYTNTYFRQYEGKDKTIKTVPIEQGSDLEAIALKIYDNLKEINTNRFTGLGYRGLELEGKKKSEEKKAVDRKKNVLEIFNTLGILDEINTENITGDKKKYLEFGDKVALLVKSIDEKYDKFTVLRYIKNLINVYDNVYVPKKAPVCVSGTKTYSNFSDYSELSKLADKLSIKDKEKFIEWAEKKYGNAFFKIEMDVDPYEIDVNVKPNIWRTQWIYDHMQMEGANTLATILNTKGIEYEDKTDTQYLTSCLNMFIQGGFSNAWYAVPLQGDKTSEDYMFGEKLDNSDIYKQLSTQTLMQEINRMRMVKERWNRLKGVKFGPKPKYKNGKLVEHPVENEDALIKNFDKEDVSKFALLDILNDDFFNYTLEKVSDDEFIGSTASDGTRIEAVLSMGHFSENDKHSININDYEVLFTKETDYLNRQYEWGDITEDELNEQTNTIAQNTQNKFTASEENLNVEFESIRDKINQFKELKNKLINTEYTEAKVLAEDKRKLIALAKPLIQIGIQIQAKDMFDYMLDAGMLKSKKTKLNSGRTLKNGEDEYIDATVAVEIRDVDLNRHNFWSNKDFRDYETDFEKEQGIKDFLLNYVANYKFASVNMQQLTITDPSFFKNTVDMQKRLGYQLHGSGRHVNVNAIDPVTQEKVSDGQYRTVIIKDYVTPANSYFAVEKILNDIEKNIDKKDEEALKGFQKLKKAYSEVNWADGQSFICPTSYRKMMLMGAGEWTERDEYVYNHRNELDASEVLRGWQPLKPLVSAMETRDMHNSVIPELNVPIQFKNSAYVIMSLGILSKSLGQQNTLTALMNFMEETAQKNPGAGIDVIQFDSAVKVGLSGVVNINDMSGDKALDTLRKYTEYEGEYNPTYVHTVGFDTFMIQQDNPEHFNDHEQPMGSQITVLAMSDLPDGVDVEVGGEKMKSEAVKEEYWKLLSEMVEDSTQQVIQKYHLYCKNKHLRNRSLNEFLQRQAITMEDVYSTGLNNVNGYTDDFTIPLSDPTQHKTMSRIYSIIKNAVFKKMIPGGPVVQVANYGTNKNLQIVFKDKDGNELKSAEQLYKELKLKHNYEWTYQQVMASGIEHYKTKKGTAYKPEIVLAFDKLKKEYQKIIKDATTISNFECYVTPYSDSLYKIQLRNKKGEFYDAYDKKTGAFDIEGLNRYNPKLLEMIGYRIPTESKYSIMPLKIKGFLPKSAGEGIMLPQEITLLSGSDFDIDKMYCMHNYFDNIGGTERLNQKQKDVNRLLELMRGSLTARQSFAEMFTPGGFETLKALSKEFGDQVQADPYETNLTNPLTQTKYFAKNMIASKMIGVFANNVSSSAFVRLCKDPKIFVNSKAGFTLDGRTILHETNIDPVLDIEGRKVALNLAEGLAASVDATKEDVLSSLNITMETVNVLTSLVRLGFPLKTAILVIANPAIREAVADYQRTNSIRKHPISFNTFLKRRIRNITKDLGDDFNVDNVGSNEEKKTNDLLSITTKELENYAKHGYMNDDKQQDKDMLRDELITLNLFHKVLSISKVFRAIQSRTGYNSSAHAFGPHMAQTLKKQSFDDEFDSMSFDPERDTGIDDNGNPIKNKLHSKTVSIEPELSKYLREHPYLNKVKECCYNLDSHLIGENFIQGGSVFREFYNMVNKRFDFLDDSQVNKLETFFISYTLLRNRTSSTGETISESVFDLSDTPTRTTVAGDEEGNPIYESMGTKFKRGEMVSYKKYITSDDFLLDVDLLKRLAEKKSHPLYGNKLLENLRITGPDGGLYIQVITANLTPQQKQELSNAWYDIYEYYKERENSEGNLAVDLVAYNVFRGSFGFNPKTFLSVLPSQLKKELNSYNKNLTNQPYYTSDDLTQMMYQFMLNYDIVDSIYDGEISELSNTSVGLSQPKEQIMYSSQTDGYYMVRYNEDGSYKQHKRIPKLGGNNVGFEVYPNLNVEDIKSSIFDNVDSNEIDGGFTTASESYTSKINEFVDTLDAADYENEAKKLDIQAIKIVFQKTNAESIVNKQAGLSKELDESVNINDFSNDKTSRQLRNTAYQRLIKNWINTSEIDITQLNSKEIFEKLKEFCQ